MQDNIHDRLGGRRILVVEDDPLLAEEPCELMRSQGVQILGPVFSLAHASQWLAEIIDLETQDGWPDMAILDVRLGKEMVFPFADALSLLGVPFLFASALTQWKLSNGYESVPYCKKPLEGQVVLRTLPGLIQAA